MIKSRLMDRYQGDLINDYRAIRQEQAIIDGAGCGLWEIQGDDAVAFLDSIVTKDVKCLYLDKALEALVLDDEANLLGVVTVINQNRNYIVISSSEEREEIMNWMNQKSKDFDVEIIDLTEKKYMFIIEGKRAWKTVEETLNFPIENLSLRDCSEVEYDNTQILTIRVGKTGEYAYSFLGDTEAIVSLAEKFLDSYDDLSLVCDEAVKICMMETNYPIIPKDKSIGVLELAYQWHIQFEKEEYCGHDKLMELFEEKPKQLTVGISYDGKKSLEGSTLSLNGENVGKIIMCGYDPGLEKMIGYALVDSELAVSGITLNVDKQDVNTISVPFVRPVSWDLAMED